MGASIRFHPGPLTRMLASADGAVGKYVSGRGNLVVKRAKQLVGKSPTDPHDPRKGRHALKNSIRQRFRPDLAGAAVEIEAGRQPPLPYAILHHEGFPPHVIRGNPLLVFDWERHGGLTVVTPSVNHPGYSGNPFLVQAAREMGLPITRARGARTAAGFKSALTRLTNRGVL